MADVVSNWHPTRHIDPNEPFLIQGYTMADNELAQFNGRYINRSLAGAVYDLAAPVGVQIVGQGGGMLAVVDGAGFRSAGAAFAGPLSYVVQSELTTGQGSGYWAGINGHLGGHSLLFVAGGFPGCSFDSTVTRSQSPFTLVNRGPFHWAGTLNGTTQTLYINGTQVDQDVVVPAAPNGVSYWGGAGTTRYGASYSACLSAADVRSKYIRDFASKVIWQWTPRDVGEGPAGGLVTNCTNFGDFFCPLGAATLKFNYVRDNHGNVGLALYDSNVGSNRISFVIPEQKPFFGSWFAEHIITDPATDDSHISFDTIRNQSTSGGSGASYWIRSHQSGGLWSLEWMRGGVGPLTSVTMPVPVANSRVQIFGTRRVSGEFQIHARVFGGRWYSSALSAADTTYLNISYISLLPRGGSIAHARWYQGEMTPAELSI